MEVEQPQETPKEVSNPDTNNGNAEANGEALFYEVVM